MTLQDEQAELLVMLQDAAALQQGKLYQIELDLAAALEEALRERAAAESARTELAKDQLRLEAMPRLEADLATLRETYEAERQTRIAAEQSAAVSAAQKDGLAERLAEDKARIDAQAAQMVQEQEARAGRSLN